MHKQPIVDIVYTTHMKTSIYTQTQRLPNPPPIQFNPLGEDATIPEKPSIVSPDILLTAHQLRFSLRATTPIHFHDFKGSALRGALTTVLQRGFCPQWQAAQRDPLHQALCPICQLLASEDSTEQNGDVRRPYSIEPPLDEQNHFAAGERFAFGLTLYGNRTDFLPYLVLAVRSMGQEGVGRRNPGERSDKRGCFEIESIDALNPLTGERAVVLAKGEQMVQMQSCPVTHEQVMERCDWLLTQLAQNENLLRIDFLTPTRLTQDKHLVQHPLFLPLAKQTTLRVLDLAAQHGGGRPDFVLRNELYPAAEGVRLVENRTRWWDVKGYSGRLQQAQMLGGLMGSAIYHADDWAPLLPWLVWGSITHVGKNIVKGCGMIKVGF